MRMHAEQEAALEQEEEEARQLYEQQQAQARRNEAAVAAEARARPAWAEAVPQGPDPRLSPAPAQVQAVQQHPSYPSYGAFDPDPYAAAAQEPLANEQELRAAFARAAAYARAQAQGQA
jgi:hypothetical protein